MTQNVTPLFSDSPRVIESVSEDKINLYGSAHGRELSSWSTAVRLQTVSNWTALTMTQVNKQAQTFFFSSLLHLA